MSGGGGWILDERPSLRLRVRRWFERLVPRR